MSRFKYNYYLIILIVVMFISISFLVYQQIFSGLYGSDTDEHIVFLYKYFYDVDPFYIPHPLWHYGVFITATILRLPIEYAAVFFSASLVSLWIYLVYRVVKSKLANESFYKLTLITFSIIIIGPLCIPWYNKIIFLGQGSPNIWHNVTLWMVQPFALLSIVFVIRAINTNKSIYYLLTILAVIISLFAKPSFAIMFLPALTLFALILKVRNQKFLIFYAIMGLFSVLILAYQFIHTFNSGDSKVVFDFLGVWSHSSQNIALSIILALAFPMLLLLFEPKIINDKYILLSWLQVFIGLIYYTMLAQTGKYYMHGNFGWSYALAMSLLYIFSIIKFFEIYLQFHRIKKYILLSLLIIQVSIGIFYFIKVLDGQNPLYVAIFF